MSILDPRERQIGEANRDNVHHLLSNLAVYPFTERLGMSIDDVNALVDRARREAANPQLKPYFPLWVFSPYLLAIRCVPAVPLIPAKVCLYRSEARWMMQRSLRQATSRSRNEAA